MIRLEKAVKGGPTYPNHEHAHISWSPGQVFDVDAWRDFLEREARSRGGKFVLHLGLDSIGDIVVVETP